MRPGLHREVLEEHTGGDFKEAEFTELGDASIGSGV